jgi:hypothetical protein
MLDTALEMSEQQYTTSYIEKTSLPFNFPPHHPIPPHFTEASQPYTLACEVPESSGIMTHPLTILSSRSGVISLLGTYKTKTDLFIILSIA